MELPLEVYEMIQTHLGQKAIAIQKSQGRGAWVITSDNQARYIPVAALPTIIQGDETKQVFEMIELFDPASQVVVIFQFTEDVQLTGIVDIE